LEGWRKFYGKECAECCVLVTSVRWAGHVALWGRGELHRSYRNKLKDEVKEEFGNMTDWSAL
jgi:hypothetical protein